MFADAAANKQFSTQYTIGTSWFPKDLRDGDPLPLQMYKCENGFTRNDCMALGDPITGQVADSVSNPMWKNWNYHIRSGPGWVSFNAGELHSAFVVDGGCIDGLTSRGHNQVGDNCWDVKKLDRNVFRTRSWVKPPEPVVTDEGEGTPTDEETPGDNEVNTPDNEMDTPDNNDGGGNTDGDNTPDDDVASDDIEENRRKKHGDGVTPGGCLPSINIKCDLYGIKEGEEEQKNQQREEVEKIAGVIKDLADKINRAVEKRENGDDPDTDGDDVEIAAAH